MDDYCQIVSVIAVIRDRNGKFLLVQRAKDDQIFPQKWQNLGGKIELGESVEVSLRREIEEEVGIKLESDMVPVFLQSYSWKKDDSSPYRLGLIFLIDIKEINYTIKLSDELMDFGWFTYDELAKLDTIGQDSPTGTLGQIRIAMNHPAAS